MILNTSTPPKKTTNDDNLIPLINVVFLMLIFFMVAGQIQPSDGVKVTPPSSINDTKAEIEPLKIVINKQGQMFFKGQEFVQSELIQQLQAYVTSVTATDLEKTTVQIKADSDLTVDDMQELLILIKQSGFSHITLITQSLEQQQYD